jgi:hypothetical protein
VSFAFSLSFPNLAEASATRASRDGEGENAPQQALVTSCSVETSLVLEKQLPCLLPSHLIHVVAPFVRDRKLPDVGFEATRRAVDNGLLSDNDI